MDGWMDGWMDGVLWLLGEWDVRSGGLAEER